MALSDLLTHALQQSQLQDSIDAERLSFSIRRTTGSFKPFGRHRVTAGLQVA